MRSKVAGERIKERKERKERKEKKRGRKKERNKLKRKKVPNDANCQIGLLKAERCD